MATGRDLPELCRDHFPRAICGLLWVQAELIAMATDLAEFVGAAVGLNLLFGVPLFPAGLITAVVAFGILALERRGYRPFERAIAGLLGIVLAELLLRRAVTMLPALVVLGLGLPVTQSLVVSQVALSFGIPLVLVPLVLLTSRRSVMGSFVNHGLTTWTAVVVVGLIVALNGYLLVSSL